MEFPWIHCVVSKVLQFHFLDYVLLITLRKYQDAYLCYRVMSEDLLPVKGHHIPFLMNAGTECSCLAYSSVPFRRISSKIFKPMHGFYILFLTEFPDFSRIFDLFPDTLNNKHVFFLIVSIYYHKFVLAKKKNMSTS